MNYIKTKTETKGKSLCLYNILIESKIINADSLEDFQKTDKNFTVNKNKLDYIRALKVLIKGTKNKDGKTVKKPIIKVDETTNDVQPFSIETSAGKAAYEGQGFYRKIQSGKQKAVVNPLSSRKPKGVDAGELQNAATHLIQDNPERSSRKHPYKEKYYTMALKDLDKLFPKKNTPETLSVTQINKVAVQDKPDDTQSVSEDEEIIEIEKIDNEENQVVIDAKESEIVVEGVVKDLSGEKAGVNDLLIKHGADNKSPKELKEFYLSKLEEKSGGHFIFKLYATALEERTSSANKFKDLLESKITGEENSVFEKIKLLNTDTQETASSDELLRKWQTSKASSAGLQGGNISEQQKDHILLNSLPIAFEKVKNIRQPEIKYIAQEIERGNITSESLREEKDGKSAKYTETILEQFDSLKQQEQQKDQPDYTKLAEFVLSRDHVKFARQLAVWVLNSQLNYFNGDFSNDNSETLIKHVPNKFHRKINPVASTEEGQKESVKQSLPNKRDQFDNNAILTATSMVTTSALRSQK